MKRASQFALFVFVALLAAAAGYLLSAPNRSGVADAGRVLAATLPDLTGTPQTIGQWQGKVLVINFWATWCAPCLEEIPHFVRLQRRLGERGLQIVGVAIDDSDKVRTFAKQQQMNYPIVIGQLAAIELSKAAGNEGAALPYTLVLDRSGRVVSRHFGGLDESTLEPIVLELL